MLGFVGTEIPLWMQVLAVPFVWAVFGAAVVITAVVVDMVRVYVADGRDRHATVTGIDAELQEAERFGAAA